MTKLDNFGACIQNKKTGCTSVFESYDPIGAVKKRSVGS